jgi:hypothetical protein
VSLAPQNPPQSPIPSPWASYMPHELLCPNNPNIKDLLSNRSLPPTHARYKETILSYDIIDFIHQKGRTNPADGLSRSGLPIGPPAHQSIEAGWESRLGIINDLYSVHRTHLHLLVPDHATEKLLSRFSNDTEMTTIIRWLLFLELAEDLTKRERDAIKKRADEYFVKNGKLWRLRKGAGHTVECLSREEGLATTLQKHEEIGHWARDILTLELRRHYDWPLL